MQIAMFRSVSRNPVKSQQKLSDSGPNAQFSLRFPVFSERRAKHANSDVLERATEPCKNQAKRSDLYSNK